jgi:hypothetical protein
MLCPSCSAARRCVRTCVLLTEAATRGAERGSAPHCDVGDGRRSRASAGGLLGSATTRGVPQTLDNLRADYPRSRSSRETLARENTAEKILTEISPSDERPAMVALRAGKVCSRCGQRKSATEFPRNSKMLSNLHSWCRDCSRQATRDWRAEHPEYERAHNEARRRGPLEVRCLDCGETFAARSVLQHRCPACQRRYRNSSSRPRRAPGAA